MIDIISQIKHDFCIGAAFLLVENLCSYKAITDQEVNIE